MKAIYAYQTLIHSSYAFNAWIPLLTYNTTYAPRFLVGNSTTVGLIVCATVTLTVAVYLQRRDAAMTKIPLQGRAEEELVGSSSDG